MPVVCLSTSHQAQRSVADHQWGEAGAGHGQWGDVEWFQAGSWGTPAGPLLRQELDQTRDDYDWHMVRHPLTDWWDFNCALSYWVWRLILIWLQHVFVVIIRESRRIAFGFQRFVGALSSLTTVSLFLSSIVPLCCFLSLTARSWKTAPGGSSKKTG